MVFVPVPNVAQANIQVQGPNGQTMENVIYFLRAVAWTAQTLADLLASINAQWDAWVRPQVSNTCNLLGFAARDLTTENGYYSIRNVTQPHAGTYGSPALPANVTFALKYQTAFVGRSFRGRSYYIGLGEAHVTGDYLATGVASTLLGAWTNMLGAVEDQQEVVHVVVSRYANGAPRAVGLATPVLSYGYADIRVDTQRRRLPGEGN